MPERSSNWSGSHRLERGVAVIITAVMLVFVIPMIGLSVDGGILYAVKSKLQMAVDAGALAGARSLSRGLDSGTQIASAQQLATEYINLNFPSDYFNVGAPTIPTPSVDQSVLNQRSVTVSASVNVPLYFLRWLGTSATTVSATATAVRRDVNVVIVMDRSGSLANSNSCAPLKQAAVNFVNKFANGRDNVGLVTFASSALNDFPAANNFLSASTDIPTILNSLVCTGATSSAEGLWLGYSQLAALNQPSALNVIIFFTDGYPTALTATFPISSSSSCSSKTAKLGVIAAGYTANNPTVPVATGGLLYQIASPQPMTSDLTIGPPGNYQGCSYASNFPSSMWNVVNDITYIPATDYYGNAMNTNYQPVTYYDGKGDIKTDPLSAQNAAVNAAASAALRIRNGATVPGVGSGIPGVFVYSIGLGNSGGVPADFLEVVANDPRASNYDSTKQSGFYIYAPTSADLSDAFSRIASQILHISK